MDFRTGELPELVLQAEFRHVLEGAGIAKPLTESASGYQLTIGDPEGEVARNSLPGTVLGGGGMSAHYHNGAGRRLPSFLPPCPVGALSPSPGGGIFSLLEPSNGLPGVSEGHLERRLEQPGGREGGVPGSGPALCVVGSVRWFLTSSDRRENIPTEHTSGRQNPWQARSRRRGEEQRAMA